MIDTLGILWCAEETKGVDTAKQQDTDVALLEVHVELFLSLSFSLFLCVFDSREVRRGQGARITRKASPISECGLTARTG